ncbi:MAG: hypothetical protein M3R38_30435 [Actinomycetota bacterium]|nr:hypothetical protein [Actinomycetota bacterium]
MTEDRDPGREPMPNDKGIMSFLDDNGRPMTVEEFEIYIEQKRQKKYHRVRFSRSLGDRRWRCEPPPKPLPFGS